MKTLSAGKRFLRAAFFAIFGPLVGLILILGALLLNFVFSVERTNSMLLGNDLKSLGIFIIAAAIVAYLVGTVPAFITGFIASFANSKSHEFILATTCGALIMLITCLGFRSDLNLLLTLTSVGSVSGFLCVLLRHRRLRD